MGVISTAPHFLRGVGATVAAHVSLTSVTRRRSVFQFDLTKHRMFYVLFCFFGVSHFLLL